MFSSFNKSDLVEQKLIKEFSEFSEFFPDAVIHINDIISNIKETIDSEKISLAEKTLIQDALISSSIKDLGDFFECFIKDKNSYKESIMLMML